MKNDLSIPVVWPLHDIGVNISGVTSLQGLGHAGIIIVDGDTGRASYSEYGRYPDENGVLQMGLIRGRELGNVSINNDQISRSDLQHLLSEFPKEKGQAWGSVFESDPDGFQRAIEFINDPNNKFLGNYKWLSLSPMHCYTYTVAVGDIMGTWQGWADPIYPPIWPANAMATIIQSSAGGFIYDPKTGMTIIGDSNVADRCFPAHTRIQTSLITSTAISALRVGDVVLAFDARADNGRGALVPRRITRLYRNTTTDWIRLRWVDGTAREVITTQGHHFLDALGGFPTIEEMTRTGSATVVLASGALTQVAAERIAYSAETAHLFERAQMQGMVAGTAAVRVVEMDAWATDTIEASVAWVPTHRPASVTPSRPS